MTRAQSERAENNWYLRGGHVNLEIIISLIRNGLQKEC